MEVATSKQDLRTERLKQAAIKEAEYLKKHEGHDGKHLAMLFILIASVVLVQYLVILWKKKHYNSYQIVSLVCLWIFPAIFFFVENVENHFLYFWSLFSVFNGYILYRATRTPLHHLTPRLIYKWYSVMHQVSYVVGVVGYVATLILMFSVPPPDSIEQSEQSERILSIPFTLVCYGLYFGVLARDFAELCSDRMASTLGYYVKGGLPNKQLKSGVCAICGWYLNSELPVQDVSVASSELDEKHHTTITTTNKDTLDDHVYKLNCGHQFHEKCLRGWCMVGKKDTCPYCHEKVNLSQLAKNPWDSQQLMYLALLDWLRYFVVWQPLIVLLVEASYYVFDLD